MPIEVEFISAPWCKRCKTLRPEVEEVCHLAGAVFRYVNMDDLDDDDSLKMAVTALPTMRTRLTKTAPWVMWVPNDFDAWKITILGAAVVGVSEITDF